MTAILDELRTVSGDDQAEALLDETRETLRKRIVVLSDHAWEGRVKWPLAERWLQNFIGSSGLPPETEQLHALYFLSQFLYFGSREIRVLLRSLYRDLFLIPLIQEVRQQNGGTRNQNMIRTAAEAALSRTRFLGVGNPSESGVHLLYFFRQENRLGKDQFLDAEDVIDRIPSAQLRHPEIDRYIFVDDVCGSGDTAIKYSNGFLSEIRTLKPETRFSYFALFGTTSGIATVKSNTIFGANVEAVYELDESYKCISEKSRYLKALPYGICADNLRHVVAHYGAALFPSDPYGHKDGQLLFGFHHNTPDNTLPIIWADLLHGSKMAWTPAFKRYPKL